LIDVRKHQPLHGVRIAAVLFLAMSISACVAGGENLVGGQSQTTSGMQAAAVPGASAGGLRVVKELPPPVKGADGSVQQIARNDVLEIDVFQVDQLDRTVQVDSNGYISLPLIGRIEAAGNSQSGLEGKIATAYGKRYLQSPQVSVFVKESAGERAVVNGQVNKAGIYPVTADSTLLGVISQAGGLSRVADSSKIYVYRDYPGGKLVAPYNLAQIQAAKKKDPPISGGDVIVVFPSGSKVALQNLAEVLGVARTAAFVVP